MTHNKIERILFWFQEEKIKHHYLTSKYYGLATLLNRLINSVYDGKRIKFININFSSQETFDLFPAIPVAYTHYHGAQGGLLAYYELFDFLEFYALDQENKKKYLWEKVCDCLLIATRTLKNNKLSEAVIYAKEQGLELRLNADYKMVENEITIHRKHTKASIWVNFKDDGMYSKLSLEQNGVVVFEKEIDKWEKGADYFLEMYKSIDSDENNIIIKGRSDAPDLPLKIPFQLTNYI